MGRPVVLDLAELVVGPGAVHVHADVHDLQVVLDRVAGVVAELGEVERALFATVQRESSWRRGEKPSGASPNRSEVK